MSSFFGSREAYLKHSTKISHIYSQWCTDYKNSNCDEMLKLFACHFGIHLDHYFKLTSKPICHTSLEHNLSVT